MDERFVKASSKSVQCGRLLLLVFTFSITLLLITRQFECSKLSKDTFFHNVLTKQPHTSKLNGSYLIGHIYEIYPILTDMLCNLHFETYKQAKNAPLGSLHEYSKTRYFHFPTLVADLSIFGPLYHVKTGGFVEGKRHYKIIPRICNRNYKRSELNPVIKVTNFFLLKNMT